MNQRVGKYLMRDLNACGLLTTTSRSCVSLAPCRACCLRPACSGQARSLQASQATEHKVPRVIRLPRANLKVDRRVYDVSKPIACASAIFFSICTSTFPCCAFGLLTRIADRVHCAQHRSRPRSSWTLLRPLWRGSCFLEHR